MDYARAGIDQFRILWMAFRMAFQFRMAAPTGSGAEPPNWVWGGAPMGSGAEPPNGVWGEGRGGGGDPTLIDQLITQARYHSIT
ncbi:MAG: hypothetical protein GY696_31585 [Gammaproteobacteria bacterium]|nr:hypothetical protein [Gammaproteobacteria bacterium]